MSASAISRSISQDHVRFSANIPQTFRNKWLQSAKKIECCGVANRLEFLIIRYVEMRAQVVGRESQPDHQTLVSKDLFVISEDGIGELGVEGGERLWFGVARLHDGNMDRIVGVARPYEIN